MKLLLFYLLRTGSTLNVERQLLTSETLRPGEYPGPGLTRFSGCLSASNSLGRLLNRDGAVILQVRGFERTRKRFSHCCAEGQVTRGFVIEEAKIELI